jgi:REP element-mobilizing transposase RayT
MPRGKRIQFQGATYHVMSRGNRKSPIYEDNCDRRVFLNIVGDAAVRYRVECPGYSLQGNHYHLVLHTPRGNIASFMQLVNGTFTQHINRRHKLRGHVFEGRYKAIVIDDTSYLRAALAYVARNPIEAGLVARPEQWQWSSYAAAQGLRAPEPFLTESWIRRAFPAATLDESRRMFAQLVERLPAIPFDDRKFILADRRTSAHVRELIGITMYMMEIPRSYKALARPDLRELLACVTRDERATAIRRAHVMYGYMLSEIARCLGVHPTTITRLLARSRPRLK